MPTVTRSQAAANIAAAIHPFAGLGGTAFVGVSSFPIL
jgi:hypothetical protein